MTGPTHDDDAAPGADTPSPWTVAPDDPRRHVYIELRSRQVLVHALRGDPAGFNQAWEAAYDEFGAAFPWDLCVTMPALLRQHLDLYDADELAGRIAEGIPYLMGCLENFRPDGK
jgi:hypothetical protein